jgi:5-methylcytosine-specific restriction protein A
MTHYLFTWNFRRPDVENKARELAEKCAIKGKVRTNFSVGNTRKIKRNDIAFMLRQGREPRGIIATGVVWSKEPNIAAHWQEKRKKASYVDIDWTNFAVEPLIGTAELQRRFRKVYWHPRASGISLPDQIGKSLALEFKKQLTRGWKVTPTASETVSEGAVRRVERNAYERSPKARQQCVAYYGPRCFVCQMTFDEKYGPKARGLIHLHHLAQIYGKRRHKTNPIRDLRPLCPNCHLVIHRKEPPYSIRQVKQMLEGK